jgi:hypothetical protein
MNGARLYKSWSSKNCVKLFVLYCTYCMIVHIIHMIFFEIFSKMLKKMSFQSIANPIQLKNTNTCRLFVLHFIIHRMRGKSFQKIIHKKNLQNVSHILAQLLTKSF